MTTRQGLGEKADSAAWELVGSVRWAMERGLFEGAPEHFVQAVEGYLRRIDACWVALGIRTTEAGHG